MDIRLEDRLTMKKTHPCGSKEWIVLRVGMDFKLRCVGCGRDYDSSQQSGKNIRKIERNDSNVD